MRSIISILIAAALLAGAVGASAADSALKSTARDMLARHGDAIVSVTIVSTQRMVMMGREMHKEEQKSEVPGTIVDPSGLTVVSNFMSNPVGSMFRVLANQSNLKIESEVSAVNLVLADGTEVPARFVLRDSDLDLAFLKPVDKPAKPFPYVPMTPAAAPPALLDDCILVGRLGHAADRQSTVSLGEVQAIVHKPRTFYVPGGIGGFFGIGCPVFNAKGEAIGLNVMRVSLGGGMNLSAIAGGIQDVILPAADVASAAKEAEAAKPAAEK